METPKSYHKTMLQVSPTGVELYPVIRNLSDSDEGRDELWSSETEDSDGSLPELPVLLPKRKSLATPPKPRSIAHRRSSSEGTLLIDRSDEPSSKFGDKWVLTRQIVHYAQSSTWECIQKHSGARYCVKILPNTQHNLDEANNLRKAQGNSSTNIVKLVNLHVEKKIYMVTEYMQGNLLSLVIRNGKYDERSTRFVVTDILNGLAFLHSISMLHNALEPSNILWNGKTYKICDFGSVEATSLRVSNYASPERTPTVYSDVWSVGAIAYFCLKGQAPLDLLEFARNCNEDLSRLAKQFFNNLVHVDPEVRLTAREALQHPWLRPKKTRRFRWHHSA